MSPHEESKIMEDMVFFDAAVKRDEIREALIDEGYPSTIQVEEAYMEVHIDEGVDDVMGNE